HRVAEIAVVIPAAKVITFAAAAARQMVGHQVYLAGKKRVRSAVGNVGDANFGLKENRSVELTAVRRRGWVEDRGAGQEQVVAVKALRIHGRPVTGARAGRVPLGKVLAAVGIRGALQSRNVSLVTRRVADIVERVQVGMVIVIDFLEEGRLFEKGKEILK